MLKHRMWVGVGLKLYIQRSGLEGESLTLFHKNVYQIFLLSHTQIKNAPFLIPQRQIKDFSILFLFWSGTDETFSLHTDDQLVAHTTAIVQSGCYASSETQGQVDGLEGSHNG